MKFGKKYPLIGPNQLAKSHWKRICWKLNAFSKRPRKDVKLTDGRTPKYSNLLSDSTPGELITPKKLNNLLSHFWERWRKEYLVNLRKSREPVTTKSEHPTIQIGEVVIMKEGNLPRSSWRLGRVEELTKGYHNQVTGAHVKVAKTNVVVQRPVSRLYNIEVKGVNVNSNMLNKDNLNKDSDHSENTSKKTKREAAIIEESKRKYTSVLIKFHVNRQYI